MMKSADDLDSSIRDKYNWQSLSGLRDVDFISGLHLFCYILYWNLSVIML